MGFRHLTRIGALVLLIAARGAWAAGAENWASLSDLTGPPDARPIQADCVRWAAGDVNNALVSAGVKPSDADIQIAPDWDPSLGAEAFDLKSDGRQVRLSGGDRVGMMYGLFEIAEQINNGGIHGDWAHVVAAIHGTRQKPFVSLRADNAFLHTNPDGPLFDVPMWEGYLDMLARNRFNMLDLHGQYDIGKTSFPSVFPLIVHVPGYADAVDPSVQAKNLADFNTIIAYAHSRGMRFGFMNYSAGAKGVGKTEVPEYTSKVMPIVIAALLGLDMLGFRIGESGQKITFYKDVYVKAVSASTRADVPLYTRSWGAKREDLQAIGAAAKGGFAVEVKFNGEQLGLPYQAIHAPPHGNPAYSYQDHLDLPANYRVIWQIRADGTHRFWDWENTEFVRRTVRCSAWGGALGFTLEPQIAYYPYKAADYYSDPRDQQVYKYIWEKRWSWYMAWGRLGYDPDLPEETLIAEFQRRYGPAGKPIYQAMQEASRIVPMVLAYRYQGPDQRDHSPETETGVSNTRSNPTTRATTRTSRSSTRPTRRPATTRPVVAPLLRFVSGDPMDSRSFVGIRQFVENKLTNRPSGSIGPAQVAELLSAAASNARQQIDSVPALDGHAADEWRLLRTDLLCASYLGDYFSARFLGMTHLQYALTAGSQADYETALGYLSASRELWKQLSDTADAVYAPLTDNLRHEKNFRWSSALAMLEEVDATAKELWAKPLQFTPGDLGIDTGIIVSNLGHVIDHGNVTVTCDVTATAGISQVTLWYKALPSPNAWKPLAMSKREGSRYAATVPITPEGLLYQVEAQDKGGEASLFPDPLKETPYRSITPVEFQQSEKK